jgi:Na+/melibiose symporter-like transporter
VNLPLGAIALFLLITKLHLPKHRTEHRIDWLGAGLLSVGITALVLITSWGGHRYAWGSAQILWLGVLGVVSLIAFAFVERRSAEPILSLGLFRNRNFALVSAMGFLLGFAMFGAMNFLPLYQQTVQGESATLSGLMLLPMMLGMMSVSLVVGNLITKTGKYKIFPIIGGILMTIGMVLLAQVDVHTTKVDLAAFMVVFGMGMGFLMQTTMLIAQNSVEQKDLGVASSAATFFRSIGGSFGVSLFGTIFVRTFNSDLVQSFGPAASRFTGGGKGGGQIDPVSLRALPDPIRLPLLHAIADGLGTLFVWAIPFAAVVAVVALFIKQVTLRGSNPAPVDGQATTDDAPALVGAIE